MLGDVEAVEPERADAYFASRAYGSRIGALASRQSQVIDGRAVLEQEATRLRELHPEQVPRPAWWSGLRVRPRSVEFWQGRRDRLHDRLRFRRDGEGWLLERLSP